MARLAAVLQVKLGVADSLNSVYEKVLENSYRPMKKLIIVATLLLVNGSAASLGGSQTVERERYSEQTIATGRSNELARPSYSPDGAWIYFDRRDDNKIWQVRRIRANGSGSEECLTCGQADMPGHNGAARVHPGGRYVAFTSEQAGHPKESAGRITPGAGFYHDIVILDLETKRFYRVRHVTTSPVGGTLFVRWSPDGRRLTWGDLEGQSSRSLKPANIFGNFRIAVANFETSPEPRLSDTKFYNPGPRPEFFEIQGWTADGRGIYVACTPFKGQEENALDFCRFDLASGEVVGLSATSGVDGEPSEYEEHGEGSPDGRRIAYMSSKGHGTKKGFFILWLKADLWLMNADGSNKRQITFFNVPGHPESMSRGRAIVSEMSWSPRGDAVIAAVYFGHAFRKKDEHKIIIFKLKS